MKKAAKKGRKASPATQNRKLRKQIHMLEAEVARLDTLVSEQRDVIGRQIKEISDLTPVAHSSAKADIS